MEFRKGGRLGLEPVINNTNHLLYIIALARLSCTQFTLHSYSRLDPTSRYSPGYSYVSRRVQGLGRYSYPATSHIISYLFIAARI